MIEGLVKKFNVIYVLQTRRYTKIHCESYIQKLLKAHSWDTPTKEDGSIKTRNFKPISSSVIISLYETVGPTEHTSENATLENKMQFSYRGLLGELLYAYIICHTYVGYTLVTLAKFATHPDEVH